MGTGMREFRSRRRHNGLPWEPLGGTKQRCKHFMRTREQADRRLRARIDLCLTSINETLSDMPEHLPRIAELHAFGSAMPFQAFGTATTGETFTFRFRYDRAFLEVGTEDPESRLVGDCRLAASRTDVTGDPYRGDLTDAEAIALFAELWKDLAASTKGGRFAEILTAEVEALQATLGTPACVA